MKCKQLYLKIGETFDDGRLVSLETKKNCW